MPATAAGRTLLPAGFSDGALSFTGDGYTAPGKVDGTAAETSLTTTYQVLRPRGRQRTVAERGVDQISRTTVASDDRIRGSMHPWIQT
jgi:hypothetical protein